MTTILAIDDKEDNLLSLSALLKNMIPECRIIAALSGMAGIDKATNDNPDVILLDIHMPVMDGFEACRILKSNQETKHIPVVMLTAVNTDSKSRVKALEMGADAFLAKPVDRFELTAQVKAMLRIKQAEDRLRMESNERFRSLIESSPDGIVISDQFGIITMWNTGAQTIFGYNPEETIGKPMAMMMPEAYRKKHMEGIHRINSSGASKYTGRTIVLEGLKKDGSVFPLEISLSSWQFEGKRFFAAIIRDLTEKTKAEAEKKSLEIQLHQSQKMESIGTLAGGIAHDFNNILFPIIGYTEMALESVPDNSDIRDCLNEILSSALRATDLVQQILSFSRQVEREPKPLDMKVIITDVLKLIRASLPSTISIEQHIDANCGRILADQTHMHQIAMNIMTNAFHAMEDDGGTLNIFLSEVHIGPDEFNDSTLTPGTYIRFSVSDTGNGIEQHIRDRIFEPYFTTKGQGKGTGLGLSVVHGIVKSYKGDIRVDSERDKGTTFHIYLPVMTAECVEDHKIKERFPVRGGTERILLVDDEIPVLKIEKQILDSLGYLVTSQTSSIEALNTFNQSPDSFDLVISDMTMPIMTGDKLAIELKYIRKDIPVILCTGFSTKMTEETAATLGIDGFLMKPIVKYDLARAIRTILDRK